MTYPFPGMNPYLEDRELWPDVHFELIRAVRANLVPQVAPKYYVAVEERTYITAIDPDDFVGGADVAVVGAPSRELPGNGAAHTLGEPVPVLTPLMEESRERFLEIRQSGTDHVTTVIEILSLTNKRPGKGRAAYETKRQDVLGSRTSLVEIDLLRGGEPFAVQPLPASDYRVVVSRGWQRPRAYLYPFNLADGAPEVPIPLQKNEAEPVLALGRLLAEIYAQARYDLRIDYSSAPPTPPLTPDATAWLDQQLLSAGLRR